MLVIPGFDAWNARQNACEKCRAAKSGLALETPGYDACDATLHTRSPFWPEGPRRSWPRANMGALPRRT
eukprot:9119852-Heterocapsa_arctica.AAC.1